MPTRMEQILTEFGVTKQDLIVSLGLTQPAVSCWLSGTRQPSPKHVKEIEAKFGIPRHLLRPDLWDPPPPKARPARRVSEDAT